MVEILVFLLLLALVGYIVLKLTLAVVKWLAVNTIVGLVLIGLLNFLGVTNIEITPLSLLIVAVGGVLGVFILVLLSLV
ncbi:pro-sigmaK processing inhibitor BofA family protein [Thermococcus thioreducens]|uniref:SigmaK-factor processing regulatory protein BofA n=1 Tax=Thermococcus thioreducens TaxID=277988 RepID=A0A0Q2RG61_9EURY|nr:pro-sigmaK processing inhibitor BofA family protein [Thermococcus thioreducens]ASJ12278.1 hypothetical protein A3L14_04960 [Thermococcus thioreducens]KQH83014.1 hypothetical protein AMR53_01955 [Thermococcus thioreducens]SEV93659.1 SigmaK-factor processing regulatory protein BofA [Thermococcus thioreducens]